MATPTLSVSLVAAADRRSPGECANPNIVVVEVNASQAFTVICPDGSSFTLRVGASGGLEITAERKGGEMAAITIAPASRSSVELRV